MGLATSRTSRSTSHRLPRRRRRAARRRRSPRRGATTSPRSRVADNARLLDEAARGAARSSSSTKLTGQPEQQPRWKRCIDRTTTALRDLLGQVFVNDRFPGDEQDRRRGAGPRDQRRDEARTSTRCRGWTRRRRRRRTHKLDAMAYHIGYPKKWRDLLVQGRREDMRRERARGAQAPRRSRQLAKIGKPVDREDWEIPASMVNAFYDPTHNRMVFPAGILQPPFYSVDASIPVEPRRHGHGRRPRADARLRRSGRAVRRRGQHDELVAARDREAVQAAHAVRGRPVQRATRSRAASSTAPSRVGENIADIGGVKLAFAAYRSLRAKAPDTVVADGFTEDQQFFLGFGQVWCAKARPEFEQHARDRRSALAAEVARQRHALRHARVREGVPLQGRHEDAPAERLRRLVVPFRACSPSASTTRARDGRWKPARDLRRRGPSAASFDGPWHCE